VKYLPTKYDVEYEGRKIYRDMRINKKTIYRTQIKRLHEIGPPGERERQHKIKKQKWRNRVQVNFICKYVLGIKGKTIPLN